MTSSDTSFYTVQFFLTPKDAPELGIFEVSINKNKDLVCTCPGFISKSSCKHSLYVAKKIKGNNGEYPLEISKKATKDAIKEAHKDPAAFREFLLMHGKVEVL